MPLFHFDVRYDGAPWSDDEEGVDFRSPEESRQQALQLALDLASDDPPRCELAIRLRDGEPEPLATVRLVVVMERRG